MVRTLLVDDMPLIRRGLRSLLNFEPNIEIVGEANDGVEALNLVRLLQPDLIIMDVEMPKMDGITALKQIHNSFPKCLVIILSIHDDKNTRKQALKAGAAAFVVKHKYEEIVEALRKVLKQKKEVSFSE